jgi:hypothetical protein
MDKDMQPVMSIDSDGDTVWRNWTGYHREDGPAIVWRDGRKDWRVNDKAHRTDGPAIEFANGGVSWWLDGNKMAFDKWLNKNHELTDEEKVMYKLRYG